MRTALVLLCAVAGCANAQGELEVLPVQGNVYAIFGPGGNSAVQIGQQGAVVVDTQPAGLSAKMLEAIGTISPRPIRHIFLTNGADQNAGGGAALSKAGRYVRVIDSLDPRGSDTRAAIMAHLNVLNRMADAKAPSDLWPSDTYDSPEWSVYVNGEAAQLHHIPAAQTDGDSIIFVRRSDVIVAGGIFDTTSFPRFDAKAGGGINGVINGLNLVLDLAVAGENQEGGTVIIPGRGRLSDETDVANYRDMVTIIRDRIRAMIAKGASLDEVKRSGPTRDYDGLYANAAWTGEMFAEAIYRDLAKERK